MKFPERIAAVSVHREAPAIYPPAGFLPFAENQLGNGDQFGLYWPLGREDREPLVCEMRHDGWTLAPSFSSLDRFLSKAIDPDDWVEAPTLSEDSDSPLACFVAARTAVGERKVDDAISLLRRATTVLPEYGEAQINLARQLARIGAQDEAIQAGIVAVIAPRCLGGGSREALAWLKQQRPTEGETLNDPLWVGREKLSFAFGGSKENPDYSLLRDVIEAYAERGDGWRACLLLQTFGELMWRETLSFQERHGFAVREHLERITMMQTRFGFDRGL